MAYVTLTGLKNYLGVATDTDDALLTGLITAVQAAVDQYCDRTFEAATETRYYKADALGPEPGDARVAGTATTLYLDRDLLTVTTLTNGDATVLTSGQYWLLPRNATPKRFILPKSSYEWSFSTDGEISVAGTWGYSTTCPLDLAQAAKEWCGYLYRLKDAQVFSTTSMQEMGVLVVNKGIPTEVWQVLERYRYRSVT